MGVVSIFIVIDFCLRSLYKAEKHILFKDTSFLQNMFLQNKSPRHRRMESWEEPTHFCPSVVPVRT